jgi:hypothetical protein
MKEQDKQPKWKALYAAAVLETNNSKLRDRIVAAEQVIYLRLRELSENNHSAANMQELNEVDDALRVLHVLVGHKH